MQSSCSAGEGKPKTLLRSRTVFVTETQLYQHYPDASFIKYPEFHAKFVEVYGSVVRMCECQYSRE
jgi:hypothetical protein